MTEVFRHRIKWRLHPVLTSVLNRLEGTALGQAFKDRAVEVSTSKVLGNPVDHARALGPHRWILEQAEGDGLPLTAADYLKPVDVQALAALMPTMQGWHFPVNREVNAHPVWYFREYLKAVGLLRKYKGTLRLTKVGKQALADPHVLWTHLTDTLVLPGTDFNADTSVVVLVHMASSEGRIDVDAVARTVGTLGWSRPDGQPISGTDIYPMWNELWAALGNVGEHQGGSLFDRKLSDAARRLINESLFTEVQSNRPE